MGTFRAGADPANHNTVETPLGAIAGKLAVLPDGETSFSPEFEACKLLAAEKNLPLKDVYEAALRAYAAKA